MAANPTRRVSERPEAEVQILQSTCVTEVPDSRLLVPQRLWGAWGVSGPWGVIESSSGLGVAAGLRAAEAPHLRASVAYLLWYMFVGSREGLVAAVTEHITWEYITSPGAAAFVDCLCAAPACLWVAV